MDIVDFKNYCFSHRNKTQGRLIILMEEVLNDQVLCDILFGKKNNVLDLKLMETVTHIFISALHEHLKPEYKLEHLKIIRLLEKKLKCRGRMRIKERIVYDRNKKNSN